MAQVLIEGVEPEVLERLAEQAEEYGITFEAQLRRVLRQAAGTARASRYETSLLTPEIKRIQAMFDDRIQPDSTEYIREDRDR